MQRQKAKQRPRPLPAVTGPVVEEWIQPQPRLLLPRNLNCEICLTLAPYSSDVLNCLYCNVVCHRECLARFQSSLSHTDTTSSHNAGTQRRTAAWVCFLCVDELDDSAHHFTTQLTHHRNGKLREQSQIIISKYWRRYRARSFYIRIYTIIVRLQIMFQIRRRKRAFLLSTQAKLRPMKVFLLGCEGVFCVDSQAERTKKRERDRERERESESDYEDDFEDLSVCSQSSLLSQSSTHSAHTHNTHTSSHTHPRSPKAKKSRKDKKQKRRTKRNDYELYILVTTVDTSHGETSQCWRVASSTQHVTSTPQKALSVAWNEPIFLGGVSGFHTLVLSLFQRRPSPSHTLTSSNTASHSSHTHANTRGEKDIFLGQIALDLHENLLWRRGGQFSLPLGPLQFELRDHIGMELKADFRTIPQGTLSLVVCTYQGLSSECGYCVASSAEDLLRAMAVRGGDASTQHAHAKAHVHAGNALPHSLFAPPPMVHIAPLSPHKSHSHRSPTHAHNAHNNGSSQTTPTHSHTHSNTHSHNSSSAHTAHTRFGTLCPAHSPAESESLSRKRTWIALAEGVVFVYSHYGDSLKLCIDLSQCFFSFVFESISTGSNNNTNNNGRGGNAVNANNNIAITHGNKNNMNAIIHSSNAIIANHAQNKTKVFFQLSRPLCPTFVFSPVDVGETLRWKCAFLSSIHHVRNKTLSQGNIVHSSVLMSTSSRSPSPTSLSANTSRHSTHSSSVSAVNMSDKDRRGSGRESFDVRLLINDLLAMDALRARALLTSSNNNSNGNASSQSSKITREREQRRQRQKDLAAAVSHPLLRALPQHALAIPLSLAHSPTGADSAQHTQHAMSTSQSTPALASHTSTQSDKHQQNRQRVRGRKPSSLPPIESISETTQIKRSPDKTQSYHAPSQADKLSSILGHTLSVSIPPIAEEYARPHHSHNSHSAHSSHSSHNAHSTHLPRSTYSAQSARVLLEDSLKQELEIDEAAANPQYQLFGEQLVSRLMTNRHAEQFVKPLLRTPMYRNSAKTTPSHDTLMQQQQ